MARNVTLHILERVNPVGDWMFVARSEDCGQLHEKIEALISTASFPPARDTFRVREHDAVRLEPGDIVEAQYRASRSDDNGIDHDASFTLPFRGVVDQVGASDTAYLNANPATALGPYICGYAYIIDGRNSALEGARVV